MQDTWSMAAHVQDSPSADTTQWATTEFGALNFHVSLEGRDVRLELWKPARDRSAEKADVRLNETRSHGCGYKRSSGVQSARPNVIMDYDYH